jgi:hypothetical protein
VQQAALLILTHAANRLPRPHWCDRQYFSSSVVKGTVSRDFRLLLFSCISFTQAREYTIKAISNFFRKFAEIFAAQGATLVSTTPVANGKTKIRKILIILFGQLDLQISSRIFKKFEMTLMTFSGAWGKVIHEKT